MASDGRALHQRQIDLAAADAFLLGISLASAVLIDRADDWRDPEPLEIGEKVTELLRAIATRQEDAPGTEAISRQRAVSAARRVRRAHGIRKPGA